MFCGINPGQKSAGEGHHFANPRNGFWRCLHLGGLTDTLIPPSQDHTLPERFRLGITNLIDRPSAEMTELSMAERRAVVPAFLRKVHKWRPKIVCMVGKGIWDDVFAYMVKASKGKCADDGVCVEQSSSESRPKDLAEQKANFQFDIQPVGLLHSPEKVERTLFFVVPSTSGRVLTHQVT
ncbi:DNA glycosylase [Ceratobasidium sp. AG-I]|nr:DNA glycosylase [Ceratobasidium sp. AG-I]